MEHACRGVFVSSPDAPNLDAIEARATSDEGVDRYLMLYGFDPKDRYPEYGHNQMREAYQAGWDTARTDTLALIAALRAAETERDELAAKVQWAIEHGADEYGYCEGWAHGWAGAQDKLTKFLADRPENSLVAVLAGIDAVESRARAAETKLAAIQALAQLWTASDGVDDLHTRVTNRAYAGVLLDVLHREGEPTT
jgi:hypothetical protein